jgi:5-methylcytosine-specific restriction endonuclease McrA
MKMCSRCGAEKPLDEFFANKKSPDGKMACCKACKTAALYAWREKNRDKWNAYVREEQKRPHRAQRKAEYRASDRAKELAREHERSPKTREKRKAYLLDNPDRAAAYNAKRNARRRGAAPDKLFTSAEWVEIKRAHGFACAYCGVKPHRLTADHVVAIASGGRHIASNIVPACRSCNSAKGTKSAEAFRAYLECREVAA